MVNHVLHRMLNAASAEGALGKQTLLPNKDSNPNIVNSVQPTCVVGLTIGKVYHSFSALL